MQHRAIDIVIIFVLMIVIASAYEYFTGFILGLKEIYLFTTTMGTMLYIKGK